MAKRTPRYHPKYTSTPAENWQDTGSCATEDPELFFPIGLHDTQTEWRARNICRDCPVIMECLAYALANGEQFGMWGGLTEKERKNLDKTSELRFSKEALVQYINERKPRILEI